MAIAVCCNRLLGERVFLRKALITLACVAAIGIARAGTASASAQQTETTVGAQAIVRTNFKTKYQCNALRAFLVELGSQTVCACNLNEKALYTLRGLTHAPSLLHALPPVLRR